MKKSIRLIFPVLTILFVACAGVGVRVHYNHEYEFGRHRTYRWMPERGHEERDHNGGQFRGHDPSNNSQNDERIRHAVEQEMDAKGYIYKPDGPADLELTYHIGDDNAIDAENYGYHWWEGEDRDEGYRHKQGSLVIDVVNPENNQLVWRGSADGVITDPDEEDAHIAASVNRILENFPGSE